MRIHNIKINRGIAVLFACVGVLFITSCEKDFGDINDSYEAKLYEANVPGLFNSIVSKTKKNGHHYRIPVAWLYQWNQSAAMYAASGYRLDDHTTDPWKDYYRSLANAHELERLIEIDENASNMTNIKAMVKVLMAYRALTTTLLYGDIPYFDAGLGFEDPTKFRPAYDSQKEVMEDAINKLTEAMSEFSNSADQVTLGSSDMLLGNDVDMWVKFANSLRLYYAMVMVEKNAAFAEPIITSALGQPLLSADEFVSLDPANISELEHNRSGFYRGNSYVRMGSTMFENMSSTNAVDGSGIYDLRCNIFFEPNEDDEWVPYPQNPASGTVAVTGNPNVASRVSGDWNASRSNFAAINVYYTEDRTIPQFLITGSQISFVKAEIYNRGLAGVTPNAAMAEQFYEEGITASVNFWYKHANGSAIWTVNKPAEAPTAAELNDMLTHPEVAYSADPATALEQIYKQSWISLFHQPFESWNLQRRTGNATPGVPLTSSLVENFNRLTYPPSEREANRQNWQAATTGDYSETLKMWFQQ